ncbi:hypothetical protein HYALB_00007761 [Hymenoscyphus albidus]|uniref:Uncharacterized protein n=1 Tax=Hymenoscyphus albidus TaxID=595503 RepID=A0A9N9Q6Y7_9HELO|nr:hypothetical protein HYALB_00007761 [Hymenoscyphus albidus]
MSSTSTPAKALGSRAISHLRTPPPLHIPKMPSNYLPPQQIYPRKQSSQSNSSFSTSSSYKNPSHAYTHQALHPTGSFPPPQTEYMRMLLALDAIPTTHNILAGLSTWLLLAGFIIFPGTFNTLSKSQLSGTTETIINTAQHIPLLVIASITSGLGLLGLHAWCDE